MQHWPSQGSVNVVPWQMINRINYISLSVSNCDLWHSTLRTDVMAHYTAYWCYGTVHYVQMGKLVLLILCFCRTYYKMYIYDINIYDYDTFILWQVLYPTGLIDLVWINRTHNEWMNEWTGREVLLLLPYVHDHAT